MSSVLDRDLGFYGLGRMELLLRTERAFGLDLPADTLQRAETVADLLGAVQQALLQPGAGATPPAGAKGHALPEPLVAPRRPTRPPGTPARQCTPAPCSKCWPGTQCCEEADEGGQGRAADRYHGLSIGRAGE